MVVSQIYSGSGLGLFVLSSWMVSERDAREPQPVSTPDGDVVHAEAVYLLAGRSGMSLVTSVNKYQWVLALPWFIILLVVSSDCIPRENQLGVDQVPGQ